MKFQLNRINYSFFFASLLFIAVGYTCMYMDINPYGDGVLGLTIAPCVLLTGFLLPFAGIFYGWGKPALKNTTQEKYLSASGVLIGAVTLGIYAITAERTTSFWDCGEFIATSCRLEIPHPPGAPLYLLLGRIFSLFAPDVKWIAYCINLLSAFASACTCAILYFSALLLLKKMCAIGQIESTRQAWLFGIGAACASLSFAFTDSFWFNATEAEVYALSCLFTALSFWGILRWNIHPKEASDDRWLLFIAYITGLSTGVHLLSILTLPLVVFAWYFKNYKVSWQGSALALIGGAALILLVSEGIIIGLPALAGEAEVFFVNSLGMPFNTGILFFIACFIFSVYLCTRYAIRKKKKMLYLLCLCLCLVIVGYSSYLLVMVRSSFNPPLDENDPGDLMSLILYLKRDQYGSRPLFYGPYFTAGQPERIERTAPRFSKDEQLGKYAIYDYDYKYVYPKNQCTVFPRIYSTSERHVEAYRSWIGIKPGKKPTMKDNLRFLFTYQLGHQYFRYFFWNFAGRSSDNFGAGWLHPFNWFEKELPQLIRDNRGRNNYFMLPLLLGMAGMFFHYKRRLPDFMLVALLFFFSGIAIVVYLNQPPVEPRERDYTFVGSFYAFCLWMAPGILGLHSMLTKFLKGYFRAMLCTIAAAVVVPLTLLLVNWDDHDRRGRYFARDSGANVLNACDRQSILFTAADNDTFPIWYLQEAEKFRTDVRTCILSYLNMDWYIRAMSIRSNESEPLPMNFKYADYRKGVNDYAYAEENARLSNGIDLSTFLQYIREKNPLVTRFQENQQFTLLPSKRIFMKVDKNKIEKYLGKKLISQMADKIEFIIPSGLSKSALIVLDIIEANQWRRPIYFNYNSIQELPFLKPYLKKEGLVFRLMPIKLTSGEGSMDTEKMYDNLVRKASWVGISDKKVYHDPAGKPFATQCRMDFGDLALSLIQQGKKQQAKEILLYSLKQFPDTSFPYDYSILQYSEMLFDLGDKKTAMELVVLLGERSVEFLKYFKRKNQDHELEYQLYTAYQAAALLNKFGESNLSADLLERARAHDPFTEIP